MALGDDLVSALEEALARLKEAKEVTNQVRTTHSPLSNTQAAAAADAAVLLAEELPLVLDELSAQPHPNDKTFTNPPVPPNSPALPAGPAKEVREALEHMQDPDGYDVK